MGALRPSAMATGIYGSDDDLLIIIQINLAATTAAASQRHLIQEKRFLKNISWRGDDQCTVQIRIKGTVYKFEGKDKMFTVPFNGYIEAGEIAFDFYNANASSTSDMEVYLNFVNDTKVGF